MARMEIYILHVGFRSDQRKKREWLKLASGDCWAHRPTVHHVLSLCRRSCRLCWVDVGEALHCKMHVVVTHVGNETDVCSHCHSTLFPTLKCTLLSSRSAVYTSTDQIDKTPNEGDGALLWIPADWYYSKYYGLPSNNPKGSVVTSYVNPTSYYVSFSTCQLILYIRVGLNLPVVNNNLDTYSFLVSHPSVCFITSATGQGRSPLSPNI